MFPSRPLSECKRVPPSFKARHTVDPRPGFPRVERHCTTSTRPIWAATPSPRPVARGGRSAGYDTPPGTEPGERDRDMRVCSATRGGHAGGRSHRAGTGNTAVPSANRPSRSPLPFKVTGRDTGRKTDCVDRHVEGPPHSCRSVDRLERPLAAVLVLDPTSPGVPPDLPLSPRHPRPRKGEVR